MRDLDYGKIGMRIRQARKVKKLTQGELAQKCGISMSFLGHIERGTKIMSQDTFVNLCEALDADAGEFLWGQARPSDSRLGYTWKQMGQKEQDCYSMYIKIMQSVAEIMSET